MMYNVVISLGLPSPSTIHPSLRRFMMYNAVISSCRPTLFLSCAYSSLDKNHQSQRSKDLFIMFLDLINYPCSILLSPWAKLHLQLLPITHIYWVHYSLKSRKSRCVRKTTIIRLCKWIKPILSSTVAPLRTQRGHSHGATHACS